MGTSSCATVSIGWFKQQEAENEAYKANPANYKPIDVKHFKGNGEGKTVAQFYSDIIYPVEQELGRSKDMPFEQLMTEINKSSLKTKLIMATLNSQQYHAAYAGTDRYWHHELKRHGFELFAKTKNSIGSVNYVYYRNPNVVAIEKDEV